MNTHLTTASAVITAVAYAIIGVQIYRGQIIQNLASRLLWAVLDGMVAASILAKNGTNWKMPAAYSAGCVILGALIVRKSVWSFTGFHARVAGMTAVCALLWVASGPVVATFALSVAIVIAGMPQVIDALHQPRKNPITATALQLIAAIVSLIGGEPSITGRMFALSCTGYFAALLTVTVVGRYRQSTQPCAA